MQTPYPTVAAVVPAHARPELLRRAVDAIVRQDYPGEIRVVVVFDRAEPDRSLESRAPGRSVTVIQNRRTDGLAGARNTGIEEVEGTPFVAFCDDDDEWLPGKLLRQVDRMLAEPELLLCTTGVVIDWDGHRISRPSPVSELTLARLVRDRTPESHSSTFLFRASTFDRVGMIDEGLPGGYSEDYDILLRVARVGRIAALRDPLVSVRWGRSSHFATRWRMAVDAQRYLLDKHPEFASDRRGDARVRGQIAFALAGLGERREALVEIGRVLRRWPLERRWPLALVVALGIVKAERLIEFAHRFGRGV